MPRFLSPINLSNLEIQNVLLHNVATGSLPATNVTGQILYDSTVNLPKWNNGSGFNAIYPFSTTHVAGVSTGVLRDTSGNFSAGTITANLTGIASHATQLQNSQNFSITGKATASAVGFNGTAAVALNITALSVVPGDIALANGSFIVGNVSNVGVATTKSTIPISGFGSATAAVDMGSQRITSVANPINATDAANKAYVDSNSAGLDVKQSCHLATTTVLAGTYNSGTLRITGSANGLLSVDSVQVATNDRILVKDQSTQSQNGIYTVIQPGDAYTPFILQRASDFDTSAEASPGSFTFIEEGSTYADTGWVMSSNDVITLDNSAIVWTQFSGPGSMTEGRGLVRNGSQFHFAQNADYTANTIPYATGATTIGFIGAGSAYQILRIPAGGGAPSFGAIDVSATAAIVGTLGAGNGGTGQNSWTTGDLLYSSATNTLAKRAIGSANQVLIVSGGLPTWGQVSLTAGVTGTLPIANGGTGLTAVGSANTVLRSNGSAALWGQVVLTTDVSGTLPAGNGGTGLASYAVGDLVYANSTTSLTKLALGAVYTVLKSNGSTAPTWGKVDLNNEVTNTLPAGSGGTGNQFFSVTGPTTSVKTFTFKDVNSTIPVFLTGTFTGNASLTSFAATHNLNSKNVCVSVYDSSDNQVFVDTKSNLNDVTFTFGVAPAAGVVYRWVVVGY